MKMYTGTEERRVGCEIIIPKELRYSSEIDLDLEPTAAGYAVARLMINAPKMAAELCNLSYSLRMAKGKERRAQRRWFIVPSALVEVDSDIGWIYVGLTIKPEGTVIQRIEVYLDAADAQAAARRGRRQ